MPQFKVRPGYAFFSSRSSVPVKAGGVVDLADVNVGGQSWKLEPVAPASVPFGAPIVEEAPTAPEVGNQPLEASVEPSEAPAEPAPAPAPVEEPKVEKTTMFTRKRR